MYWFPHPADAAVCLCPRPVQMESEALLELSPGPGQQLMLQSAFKLLQGQTLRSHREDDYLIILLGLLRLKLFQMAL